MERKYAAVDLNAFQVARRDPRLNPDASEDSVGIKKGSLRLEELVVHYHAKGTIPGLPGEFGIPGLEFDGPDAKARDGLPLNEDDVEVRQEMAVLQTQIAVGLQYVHDMTLEREQLEREYEVRATRLFPFPGFHLECSRSALL